MSSAGSPTTPLIQLVDLEVGEDYRLGIFGFANNTLPHAGFELSVFFSYGLDFLLLGAVLVLAARRRRERYS